MKEHKKGFLSIGVKMALEVFCLLLIVCGVLTFVSYETGTKIIRDNLNDSLENRAQENSAMLGNMIDVRKAEIETLARRDAITSMDWDTQEPVIVSETARLGY